MRQRVIVAREMMFGLREEFEYSECAECGSVQIIEIPADLAKYYPSNYYSFAPRPWPHLGRWLRRWEFQKHWRNGGVTGPLARPGGTPFLVTWLQRTGIRFTDSILDVGCGTGELLMHLHDVGFKKLTGIDAFIERDSTPLTGLRILKCDLSGMNEQFDMVMFHHSLEHVESPENELERAANLLVKGKYAVVRLPVAGSFACREYGADWVGLDPPRHLAVPTELGMRRLAQRTGYVVDAVLFDSGDFQFWASEQYRHDIPLYDERSWWKNRRASIFSKKQIKAFREHAVALNQIHDGDAACFLLRRI